MSRQEDSLHTIFLGATGTISISFALVYFFPLPPGQQQYKKIVAYMKKTVFDIYLP
jgi:hypothetical protein